MGVAVFIDGRAVVHKGSVGQAIAFPDVCLCPPSPPADPIPTRHADLLTHNQPAQHGNTPPTPWMSRASPPPVAPEATLAERRGLKWVEITLVDQDNDPVPNARFELKLPDGPIRRGLLGKNGSHLAVAVPEGQCEVRFPDLDAGTWRPA